MSDKKTKTQKPRAPSRRGGGLLLTLQQASETSGIPAYTLRELIRFDGLPHVRLGRSLWFHREALAEWLAGRVVTRKYGGAK
jgi:excisionase family DNA binding protein